MKEEVNVVLNGRDAVFGTVGDLFRLRSIRPDLFYFENGVLMFVNEKTWKALRVILPVIQDDTDE